MTVLVTKRRKRDSPLRPWLLGTDEIPPPMDVPFQMWSKSSSPYEQGLITFEFTSSGLAVGWWQEGKKQIDWHELAFLAGCLPRSFQEDMQHLRESSETEAFATGYAQALATWKKKVGLGPQSEATLAMVKEAVDILRAYLERHPETSGVEA